MQQLNFFKQISQHFEPRFDGATFSKEKDGNRLNSQLEKVRTFLLQGGQHSLFEISWELNIPESSVSARIRDLRKPKFGGYNVISKRVFNGTWVYSIQK